MHWYIYLVAGIALISMSIQNDDQTVQKNLYCEQVKVFKETKGEYGWPDYSGTYSEECR